MWGRARKKRQIVKGWWNSRELKLNEENEA
jgi:hypothetical protein